MKLFGGKKDGGHVARERAAPAESESKPKADVKPAKAAQTRPSLPERVRSTVATFFRDGAWKKYRTPLLAAGCVVLVILAALLVHAVMVRPPATRDDGLNTPENAAIRPAVEAERPIATPPPEERPDASPPPEETEELKAYETEGRRKESCYTFVLLASDQVSGNTDTILVGRLDTDGNTFDFVNIPRDTLVDVSWQVKKLNTVYSNEREDPERFIAHLSGLLGFSVDNYAVLNLRAIEQIVDAMGGVDYYVPRSMDYDDPDQDLHIHIAAGQQHLSGADAVKVLRFRVGNDGTGYADGDLGRIRMQQDFLRSMASQFLTLGNIPNLEQAIRVFEENVKTDLSTNNLMFFAERFLTADEKNIRFHTAPGTAVGIRGGSYYELDPEGWIALLNDALNPYTAPVTESNLDVLRYLGSEGAISTTGDLLPLSTFYDFYSYFY